MMNKKAIFIAFLVLIGSQLNGQSLSTLSSFYNNYFVEKKKEGKQASRYLKIEGLPYENIEFEESIIHMKNKKSYLIPLRHNIYANTFEFKLKNRVLNINNPDDIIKIELKDKTYIYFPIDNKKVYLELLVSGNTNLVRKAQVILKPAEKPSAYKEMKPPRFHRSKDLYYLIDNQGTVFLLKKKKSFLKYGNVKKEELEIFINKEKINIKKEEDLVKLIKFFNTLLEE